MQYNYTINMEKNAVIYSRYSDKKQDTGFSIEAQLDACREYCQKNNLLVHKEYIDRAKSGRSADRPAFKEMMSDSKKKDFSFVIVHKFDRFGRDRYDQIIFKRELKNRGIKVESVSEPIADGVDSVLLESIYEGIAEANSKRIGAESKKGMAQAIKMGFWVNGQAPYGYILQKIEKNGRIGNVLAPHPAESLVVKRIFKLYCDGLGIKAITQILNREGFKSKRGGNFNGSSTAVILANGSYTHRMLYHSDIRNSISSSIISKSTYEKAQKIREDRKLFSTRNGKADRHKYPLTGLIKCPECNAPFVGRKQNNYYYYYCSARVKGKLCSEPGIRQDKIEPIIFENIKRNIITTKNIKKVLKSIYQDLKSQNIGIDDQIKECNRSLREYKRKYERLISVLESTDQLSLDDIGPRIRALKDLINKESSNAEVLKARKENNISIVKDKSENTTIISTLKDLLEQNLLIDTPEKIRNFVKTINIDNEFCEIEWVIPVEDYAYGQNWLPKLTLMRNFIPILKRKSFYLSFKMAV